MLVNICWTPHLSSSTIKTLTYRKLVIYEITHYHSHILVLSLYDIVLIYNLPLYKSTLITMVDKDSFFTWLGWLHLFPMDEELSPVSIWQIEVLF